jgi:hypothetical protein
MSDLGPVLSNESEVKFTLPEVALDMCEHAEEFKNWVDDHLRDLDLTDLVTINEMILLLTLRYNDWYNRVSKPHRNRVGDRGHRCIFHVFMETLNHLANARTKVDPPVYYPTVPQPGFEDRGTLLGLVANLDDERA